jgi:hypothetical protein
VIGINSYTMKTNRKIIIWLNLTVCLLSVQLSGQIIVRHHGASDPIGQGFDLSGGGPNVQVEPVFGDGGLDSWKIRSMSNSAYADYYYRLTSSQLTLAMTQGWEMVARMRFVEIGFFNGGLIAFHMGDTRFRLGVTVIDEHELLISGDGFPSFTLQTDALAYHEYRLVFDPALDAAAIWIDGALKVAEVPGVKPLYSSTSLSFGAPSEGIKHSHWNEVTFRIIPEPATVALLAGLGALLLAGVVRRRRRQASSP